MIYLAEGISPENLDTLYSDPFVERIKDDDMAFAPISHPLVTYLSAFHDDTFIGAYLVVKFSDCEYEAHSLLMRPATAYSRQLGTMLLEWVFSHSDVLRLTGYIRDGIPTAINHCLKMGFTYEGFRRDALRINGAPTGIHILGLTRKDWEAA